MLFRSLLNVAPAIHAIKRKSVTFKYEAGSSQGYTDSNWIGTDCLSSSYFSVFFADGFRDDTETEKTLYKSVSGNGQFYTNCNANGATATYVGFAETSDPMKVSFSTKQKSKNATVVATLEAFLISQDCGVASDTYVDDFDGMNYTYFYYNCSDTYTETFTNITVDTFLKVGPNAGTYTSKSIDTSTFRGTVQKYESMSTCQDASTTKKVIKIGRTRLNIPSFSTYGQICKVSSGYETTIKFI